MADLRLDVVGEDKGASATLRDVVNAINGLKDSSKQMGDASATATAKATVGYGELLAQVKSLASAVIAFGKESVQAFAEADRIGRQLQRTAGDMTGAFEAQATALSNLYAVDDEMVKQQETLLLQWGLAPSKVGDATAAILDYAAAFDKDAITATREFIRATENGGEKLKALGIDFQQTGDKAKDAAVLIELFRSKFGGEGGAGAARANSLEGELTRTSTALGNLKESFGGLIAKLNSEVGALFGQKSVLTWAQSMLTTAESLVAMTTEKGGAGLSVQGVAGTLVDFMKGKRAGTEQLPSTISDPLAFVPLMGEELAPSVKPGQFANRGSGGGGSRHAAAEADRSQRETDLDKELQNYNQQMEAQWLADRERERSDSKAREEVAEKNAKAAEKAAADMAKRTATAAAAEQQQMQQAGEALGMAFVGGLSTQLAKLAGGGEFDIADFLLGLLPAVGGLAGMAIGGPGGAALGGAIGQGLGQIGGAFAHRKMHDGGWVGLPRYHSGTWVGSDEHAAILQSGERVLSRSEVSRMGGAQGVDGAARGGGAVNVTVNTLDGSTASEYFKRQGGRALYNARRTGGGNLQPVFGGA